MTIRAHFDGKVIVPDEPVLLPRDTPLTLSVATDEGSDPQGAQARAAFDAFLERAKARAVPRLSDDATRRDAIYED